MQTINMPVSMALKLLWSHERGELCNEQIPAASAAPEFSLVNEDGGAIDITVADYDGSDAYGIHTGNGTVYYANAVFNGQYIAWPDGTTDQVKALITAQLKKSFLIIK